MKKILTLLLAAWLLLMAVSAAELTTVKELNTVATAGSHLADDYKTASMEENYREQVVLNYMTTGYTEYNKAYYPRLLKLREDLYLLFFHGTSTGGDIFKNTVGTSTLTCRLWQNGTEVDLSGTEHTYKWYRWDKDGNVMDEGAVFATGKSIEVDGDDVDTKTTFICEVS